MMAMAPPWPCPPPWPWPPPPPGARIAAAPPWPPLVVVVVAAVVLPVLLLLQPSADAPAESASGARMSAADAASIAGSCGPWRNLRGGP
jgi:hypothetical protein